MCGRKPFAGLSFNRPGNCPVGAAGDGADQAETELRHYLSMTGVGPILGTTILLETGEINRFKQVGHYASYCRCVKSEKTSNGKKKGEGNAKSGNKY